MHWNGDGIVEVHPASVLKDRNTAVFEVSKNYREGTIENEEGIIENEGNLELKIKEGDQIVVVLEGKVFSFKNFIGNGVAGVRINLVFSIKIKVEVNRIGTTTRKKTSEVFDPVWSVVNSTFLEVVISVEQTKETVVFVSGIHIFGNSTMFQDNSNLGVPGNS